ncbi:MAG: IS1595 family transposase [Ferruginibacter sp.]
MPTEEMCRDYVAQQRWNGKPVCPYCKHEKCYVIEGGKRYKCASTKCFKRFTVTVGTIFEASNIPLFKWLTAIYLISSHKKGISSYQVAKDIGVTQKTGWFMLHRIREMMKEKHSVKLDNIVEIDEVYIGGKVPNMSKSKRKKLREDNNIHGHKTMVMGMIERGGNLKLIPIGGNNNVMAIQPTVRDNVDNDAVLITDSLASYQGLNNEYAGHEVVNHSEQEYVRDSVFHTNSIEGAFSLLKRSIIGIYHQVTPKHLSRYCDETMHRYNLRKMTDAARFNYTLTNIEGRLDYKTLVNTTAANTNKLLTENDYNVVTKLNSPIKGRPVYQVKDGEVISRYNTLKEAAAITGIKNSQISKALKGVQNTAGGFQWIYA